MTIVRTAWGREVDLVEPDPATIHIDDIAHHLARINRFSGATRETWSVAAHSLLVAELMGREGCTPVDCLYGLLHDAHEYVVGDIVSPVSGAVQDDLNLSYEPFELVKDRLDRAIWIALDLDRPAREIMALVKRFDALALGLEARDLLPNGPGAGFGAWLDEHAEGWRTMEWPDGQSRWLRSNNGGLHQPNAHAGFAEQYDALWGQVRTMRDGPSVPIAPADPVRVDVSSAPVGVELVGHDDMLSAVGFAAPARGGAI